MAVSVSVDNRTVIAHHAGQGIGVINVTHYAVNVKVIVFSLTVLAQNAFTAFLARVVILIVVGRVSVNVKRSVGNAHIAISVIGEAPVR